MPGLAVARATGPGRGQLPATATATDALRISHDTLLQACRTESAAERYICSHLAAVRAASAVLASRARPGGARAGRSVWEVMSAVAPELAEWAQFLSRAAARRRAVEARGAQVTAREADDLLRQVELFCEEIRAVLGLPIGHTLPAFTTPASRP